MKFYTLLSCLGLISMLLSCGGDSSEEPKIDCSESGLEIQSLGTVNADCDELGSLEVLGSGGEGTISYSIDGVNFQSSGLFSVASGSYTVTAKDENECTTTTTINVGAEDNGISIGQPSSTDSGCEDNNATITVTASGGVGELSYSLNSGSSQSEGVFTNLEAGTYSISVTDSEGCSTSRTHTVLTGVSLANDIMPLLAAQCTFSGCHNGDNGSERNWTQKEDVLAKASNIKARTQSGAMPMSPGVLTQSQIDMIACWVDDGALDN